MVAGITFYGQLGVHCASECCMAARSRSIYTAVMDDDDRAFECVN